MEKQGEGVYVVLDRQWASQVLGRHIDSVYSSRSNASRAIHDVKRNLTTALCSFSRSQAELAEFWFQKYSRLLLNLHNAVESSRIHFDSYESDE